MTPTRLRVELPSLHAAQQAVEAAAARFTVLAMGRRWGKSKYGARCCTQTALRGGTAWWIAPEYKTAMIGWDDLRRLARQIPETDIRESERRIVYPTGGLIELRSADDKDRGLRGKPLDFAFFDEAALIHELAWTAAIRPALADRKGHAMFASTPRGHDWFWRLYERGQDSAAAEWRSFQMPTSTNPFIDPTEIEAARAEMSARLFAQEFEAQFLDDAGGVFRGVRDLATAIPQERAIDGHEYVIGVDWGREGDFTVTCVLDVTLSSQCYMDRSNRVEYATQRGKLLALAEKFRPRVIVAEANAMGLPIIEGLQRDGLPVQAFTTTNATKAQAVDALALAFERGALTLLPDPVQLAELQAYEATRLPSGLTRYSAPGGMHDDTVMGLLLAWTAVSDATRGGIIDLDTTPAPAPVPHATAFRGLVSPSLADMVHTQW